ncbi:tyrosine-type recombinase/integrase [Neomoorella humiferrea]|uniref:tyrosine-type recombinase/integrase n=1 Tax=Neomoorella humiferrea TaxID=676965 RepID=UPI003D903868
MKAIFSYLVRKQYISSDPTQEITVPRSARKVIRESRVIPIEIRKELAKYAWKKGFREYLIYCLEEVYGARPKQIQLLRWTDIDFANKTIRFIQLKHGDTGGGPVPDELLELLKEFKDGGYGGKEYVFRSRQNDSISDSRMKDIITNLHKGNFKVKEYNSHDMRTTVATELSIAPGCNTRTVQQVLGHKRAETTVGYERANSEVLKRVISDRFNMVNIEPWIKDDTVDKLGTAAVEKYNQQQSKGENLKPEFKLPADIYLRQNLDVNNILALATINLRKGILNEREYRITLEALFSSLNINCRWDGIPATD